MARSASPDGTASPSAPLVIDCNRCLMVGTRTCRDCVVNHLLEGEPEPAEGRTQHAVVIGVDELRALRALADRGLVPHLRHRSA